MEKTSLDKLQFLCKADNLSFMIQYDNHKRYGLTPTEYFAKFNPEGFKDPEGQSWLRAMDSRNSIVSVTIYDNQMKPRFVNYDVNLEGCLVDTIECIQSGLVLLDGEQIETTPAPTNPM